jgi:hypothetical protein
VNNDRRTRLKVVAMRRHTTVVPTAYTSNFDGLNYRTALVLINIDLSGGGKSLTWAIEDSDDGTTFNATGLSYSLSGIDALTVGATLLDLTKLRRYVRVALTAVGGTPAPNCVAVLYNEAVTPDSSANVDVAVV